MNASGFIGHPATIYFLYRRPESGGIVSSTGDAPASATPIPANTQGMLFDDDLPHLSADIGYRGPTACSAAGITYRQLDYWARTGLVQPSVRSAAGSGSQRLYSFRDILVLKRSEERRVGK